MNHSVYGLIKDSRLFYIGITRTPSIRLRCHQNRLKDYSVSMIILSDQMNKKEAMFFEHSLHKQFLNFNIKLDSKTQIVSI